MQKEIIDVDYVECEDDDKKEPVDITVNADPISTLFSSIASVANTITGSIKEYNMCRQHEETQRAAIKAQLKAELAQIDAKKESFLKLLENRHEINKMFINNAHEVTMKKLEEYSSAIDSAIKIAEETHDFESVITLLKISSDFCEMRSKIELSVMEQIYSNNPIGAINMDNNMKYLE